MRMGLRTGLAALVAMSVVTAGAPGFAAEKAKPAVSAKTVVKAKATKGKAKAPLAKAKAKAPAPAPTSALADQLAGWVTASADNQGMPFVIIDKVASAVFVYTADGTPMGATPALLGSARGDDSVEGIGDRPLNDIRPEERTTPAGRFVAGFGPAVGAERAFWVDYGTAISLHPVVTTNPKERRVQRLRSPTPADNRITYGCINVAAGFYEKVIRKTFGDTKGVVYILPDLKPVDEVFPSFGLHARANAATAVAAAGSGN